MGGWPPPGEAVADILPVGRTLRYVPEELKDKVISDQEVLATLLPVFRALFTNDLPHQLDVLAALPEPVQSKYQDLLSLQPPGVHALEHRLHPKDVLKPEEIVYKTLGFSVARAASSLVSAGKGVFVTAGLAPKGAVVSMYPGNGTAGPLPERSYVLVHRPVTLILRVCTGNSDFHRFFNLFGN